MLTETIVLTISEILGRSAVFTGTIYEDFETKLGSKSPDFHPKMAVGIPIRRPIGFN